MNMSMFVIRKNNKKIVKQFLKTKHRRQLFSSSSSSNATGNVHEDHSYDYVVIGGGSGGLASARRAAMYGKKVALIERGAMGGTCVNVGCVPKKIMWNSVEILNSAKIAPGYGFEDSTPGKMNWNTLKTRRDAYIKRLNGMYERNLADVDVYEGFGTFVKDSITNNNNNNDNNNNIKIGISNDDDDKKSSEILAKHVLIATGGYPTIPDIPGGDMCLTSDGFFEMDYLPKKVAIVGAGYIAVELASVLQHLGSEVTLFVRGDGVLRSFDTMVQDYINKALVKDGINLVTNSLLESVTMDKNDNNTKNVKLQSGDVYDGFDEVICAIGRKPMVNDMGFEHVNVKRTDEGHIVSDEYQETGVNNIYALGDVCGYWELTPVAIAAGRRLSDRIFGNMPNAKLDYTNIPTVVFTHPPVGTIGDTEEEAIEKYGADNIKVYTSVFVNMWYSLQDVEPRDKERTHIKMICSGTDEKVVGLHIVGMASDEMLQGFGVAMKMNATKKDFDNCVAIHPVAAEEVVTIAPWGLSGTAE